MVCADGQAAAVKVNELAAEASSLWEHEQSCAHLRLLSIRLASPAGVAVNGAGTILGVR